MELAIPSLIVIRGICERDIDLLLLEEFVASSDFRIWFFMKIGVDSDAVIQRAERSVSTQSGESDIELTVKSGSDMLKVLIENKIDAPLQPKQAERYRERALAYCSEGLCSRVITVAVAPEVYFDETGDHGFDVLVLYEDILRWFQSATALGLRGSYKAAALTEAIKRGRQGWQMVPDATTTAFWRMYWELAEQIAPKLRMPKPDAKPADSCFIPFKPLALKSGVSLYHKVTYGHVQIAFAGMGEKLGAVEKRFGQYMSPDMRVEKAAKSAAIRVGVEEIDMCLPFAESMAAVEDALKAALSLLQMYETSMAK